MAYYKVVTSRSVMYACVRVLYLVTSMVSMSKPCQTANASTSGRLSPVRQSAGVAGRIGVASAAARSSKSSAAISAAQHETISSRYA